MSVEETRRSLRGGCGLSPIRIVWRVSQAAFKKVMAVS
jgi:hypothetical protein